MPVSTVSGEDKTNNYFCVNQYGVFPRAIFEKVGFATPYFYRGAEDYELMFRLQEHGLLSVNKDARVIPNTTI